MYWVPITFCMIATPSFLEAPRLIYAKLDSDVEIIFNQHIVSFQQHSFTEASGCRLMSFKSASAYDSKLQNHRLLHWSWNSLQKHNLGLECTSINGANLGQSAVCFMFLLRLLGIFDHVILLLIIKQYHLFKPPRFAVFLKETVLAPHQTDCRRFGAENTLGWSPAKVPWRYVWWRIYRW